ncbi:MAG: TRAP transporter substrate-binding protein DctP [Gammaproteobacteria bacterium]|nr:TRAP transporter substrate-binding protein DctP [Gammaproteobacteria bacterium]
MKILSMKYGFLILLFFFVMLCVQTHSSESVLIVDGPKLRWDISLWGTTRPGTRVVEALSEQVKKLTNGNWEIKLHYGEALSKSRENLDGISIGAFDGAMICNFYHPKKNPGLMVLSLPFLPIDNWDDHVKVRKAVYGHEQVKKEMAKWGAQIYSTSYLPMYEVMGKGKPPRTVADWKALNVRAGGGIGEVLAKIGATPTSTTATEVYTGVQQGTMDAAAFPFTYAHVSYRIHEVSDWFTSNFSPGTADCPVVFSRRSYDKLPSQYQELLERLEPNITKQQRLAYEQVDSENLPMLREKLTEVRYTDEVVNQIREDYARPVIEEWIEENEKSFDARGLVQLVFEALGHEY